MRAVSGNWALGNVPSQQNLVMSQRDLPAEGERVALSFHDSLLRRCDVELLRDSGWLNDRLIGFYFE